MNIVFGLIASAVAVYVLMVVTANVIAFTVDGAWRRGQQPPMEETVVRTDDHDRVLCCAVEEGTECELSAVVVQAFVGNRGARRIRYPWVACLRHSCGESWLYIWGLGYGSGVTLFLDLNGFTLLDLVGRMDSTEVSVLVRRSS